MYLGHVVGSGEVKPELDKVKANREFPRPVTKKDVHSFLGLTGYYPKFTPSCASIVAPLSDLTKKCNPQVVKWGPECEVAFHRLKEALCAPLVLTSPVPASLPLWPGVYYPVRSPCFTMVGQNEGQEFQTNKMEFDVAELQVHSAAQAKQGE